MKNILFVLGTRPEAIKLAPVILEFRKFPDRYNVIVCNTEQQKELSNQTLDFFGLDADIRLDVMQPNQSLAGVQSRILDKLSAVYAAREIHATVVQGDTMTVLCGSLVSFYNRVPVLHVEAGLRSYDLNEPFPEEAIRQMAARIVETHFAPTEAAKAALMKENIREDRIHVTGNTVIDAMRCLREDVIQTAMGRLIDKGIHLSDRLVLITAHRRENHGRRLDEILSAVKELSASYPDHQFVLPVHPNPNVRESVHRELGNIGNVVLTAPMDYPELVGLMSHAKLILTDSGGIQEEAPSFGVPVLVMRFETERKEGLEAGYAKLVGSDKKLILQEAAAVLTQDRALTRLDGSLNPYGDGNASERIRLIMESAPGWEGGAMRQ
jgi:UDP-N-acetylglucosamine 2-epimerase (non-hydrolysing)